MFTVFSIIIHAFCLRFSVSSWHSVCQINLRVLFPAAVFMPAALLKKKKKERKSQEGFTTEKNKSL